MHPPDTLFCEQVLKCSNYSHAQYSESCYILAVLSIVPDILICTHCTIPPTIVHKQYSIPQTSMGTYDLISFHTDS